MYKQMVLQGESKFLHSQEVQTTGKKYLTWRRGDINLSKTLLSFIWIGKIYIGKIYIFYSFWYNIFLSAVSNNILCC